MRFDRLQDWLDWQETLHPVSIHLKLERVAAVADALHLREGHAPTITVAGTNGKGTVATVIASLLRAMGYRVGVYTSPHLLRYNERVAIDGQPVSDQDLCRAFAAADAVRGPNTLTYFEFGTLAAAWLFREARVDFQVLEVGMGGRLDAVNVWNPAVAVITSVDVDHERWLGSDRESIGREKAGILRPRLPAVLGEEAPPLSVLDVATKLEAKVFLMGRDFALETLPDGLSWRWAASTVPIRMRPNQLQGLEGARLRNVATALAVIQVLGLGDRLAPDALAAGLCARPPGRLQEAAGSPDWLLDVAHNAQSARELARWLATHPVAGATVAIVAIMADKSRRPMFEALLGLVDSWVTTSIPSARAVGAAELAEELRTLGGANVSAAESTRGAMSRAQEQAGPRGRVVVFGSFLTVQAVMEELPSLDAQADAG